MAATDWLAMYPSDFFGSWRVGALSWATRGAYVLLLMRIWQTEWKYKVPHDEPMIMGMIGMNSTEWEEHKADILSFFEIDGDFLVNTRLQREYGKILAQREKSIQGANKRWKKDVMPHHKGTNATALPPVCPPQPPPPPHIKKKTISQKEFGEEKWGYEKDPDKTLYRDLVYLKKEEYDKLHQKYGPMLGRIIEKLDAWKENKGKKGGHYISDYKAILQWVAPEVEKEFSNRGRGSAPAPAAPRPTVTGNRNREADVTTCNKCEKPTGSLIDHRGMRLCRDCYDLVKPEMPAQLRGLLNSIGGENA